MFYKIGVLKNFVNFLEKHLCLQPAILVKKYFSVKFERKFLKHFFLKTPYSCITSSCMSSYDKAREKVLIRTSRVNKFNFQCVLLRIFHQPISVNKTMFLICTPWLYFNLQKMKERKYIAQHKKMKFSIKDFFSKCDQIRQNLRIP